MTNPNRNVITDDADMFQFSETSNAQAALETARQQAKELKQRIANGENLSGSRKQQ